MRAIKSIPDSRLSSFSNVRKPKFPHIGKMVLYINRALLSLVIFLIEEGAKNFQKKYLSGGKEEKQERGIMSPMKNLSG